MERTRGRARPLIAVAALAACLLTACTKAGGVTTSPGPGASGSDSRGLPAGKIILAGDATLSIPGAEPPFPGIQQGIEARIARANRQGGIDGRKIEYLGTMDDQGSQSTLLSNIQQAVLSKNAFGIGPVITVAQLPTAFIAQNAVPTFGFGDSPGWCNETYAMSFDGCLESTNIGDDTTAALVAQYLGGGKGKTYGLIFTDDQQAGLTVDAAAARAVGFSVCYAQATVPLTPVSDYTPYVIPEMRDCGSGKGPDVMFVAPTGLQAELGIINGLHAAGYKGLIVTATYDPNLLKAPGVAPALAGSVIIVYSVAPEQFSTAGLAQFKADLAAIGAPTSGGFSYGELLGYAATDFMIRALQHVGKHLTAAALAAQMKSGYIYPGMSGFIPSTSYPNGHKEATPCGSLLKVSGTTFVPAVPLTCYRDIPLP
jgi:branched-chain amino acid transport system substrate-binding protein